MKKYLSILVLFSLFNGVSAMIVDTPIEKLYSIEAKDGEIVQFPQQLVNQCVTLKDMIGDLEEGTEGEVIPVPQSSTSLQLLVSFHSASDGGTEAFLESKTLEETIDAFKAVDFLAYLHERPFIDNILKRITSENLEAILKNELQVNVSGEQENKLVERLVNISKPLIAQYCLSNSPKTLSGHREEINSVCVTPDGSKVITGSRDGTAKIWDRVSGTCLQTLSGPKKYYWITKNHWINSVCMTPDGSKVITGSRDGTAKIWDRVSGTCLQTLSGPKKYYWITKNHWINSVCMTPDGSKVITGSVDNTAKIWDIETGACMQTLRGHSGVIWSVDVTPDSSKFITGSGDRTAKIWDIETGVCVHTLSGHTGPIRSVDITPDGSKVITGSGDSTAKIWDIETGVCLQMLSGHTEKIYSVCVAPDGSKVITGSGDSTAKIWDIVSGVCLHTLSGHTHWIVSVGITPDGSNVITGSRDNTAKIWDIETGACLHTLSGHTVWIHSVCATPDGSKVITGSDDHTAKIWDIYDPPLERALKHASLSQALLGYYALTNRKAARQLIESFPSCREIYDSCDPALHKIIPRNHFMMSRMFSGLFAPVSAWWFKSE